MRITFVLPPPDLSGGCKVVALYARKLAERGHEVLVVAPPCPRPTLGQWVRGARRGELGKLLAPVPPSHLELQRAPHRLLERCRPVRAEDVPDADVIVATWWETAEWIRDLPASKGAPAYFIQHHEVHMPGQPHDRVNATLRLPFHKIAISRWLVDVARDVAGDEDVSLVFNSVDPDQFSAPPREKNATPTVGFMYSTVEFKGLGVVLAALAKAQRELPTLRVVSFGVEEPSPSLPLPRNAHYVRRPPQEAIRDLYARCDVWMCGSRAEGFHLPPLEAMACRCPVVSTRVGGPIDVVRPGENGWLVDVGDADALADRTVDVLRRSAPEWLRMSEAALRTALDYTWDDATDRLEDALVRAVEKQPRPHALLARSPSPPEHPCSRVAMVCGNLADGSLIRPVLEDWYRGLGGRPGQVVMVDDGGDLETQHTIFELAREGVIDRAALVHPRAHDTISSQRYGAENLAGALAHCEYLLWLHVDGGARRRGLAGELGDALELLERDDTFALGGSCNVPSEHHHAPREGLYFSEECSESFALMKRERFTDAMSEAAADFVRSGYRGAHPATEPGTPRSLVEIAFERAIERHRRFTLCCAVTSRLSEHVRAFIESSDASPAEPRRARDPIGTEPSGPRDRTSVVIHADGARLDVAALLAPIEAALQGRPRQIVLYVDPSGPAARGAWRAYREGRVDDLLLVDRLGAGPADPAWWVDHAVLAAALEPIVAYVRGNDHARATAREWARAIERVERGAGAVDVGERASEHRVLLRSSLIDELESAYGGYVLSGMPTLHARRGSKPRSVWRAREPEAHTITT